MPMKMNIEEKVMPLELKRYSRKRGLIKTLAKMINARLNFEMNKDPGKNYVALKTPSLHGKRSERSDKEW